MVNLMSIDEENASEVASNIRRGSTVSSEILQRVMTIIEYVKRRGDEALLKLALELDDVELRKEDLITYREEMKKALNRVSPKYLRAIKKLDSNIRRFERRRLGRLSFTAKLKEGYRVHSKWLPLSSVGCYIPGGRASYPSTILMTGSVGDEAGVSRLVAACPPRARERGINELLAAAYVAGFDELLWAGGAQAIAALAYGTESVKPVRKIVGPGNVFVNVAKKLIYPDVDVDLPAGPTELLVVFDSSSRLDLVVHDMLAQAEHSPDTLVGAVSTERGAVDKLYEELRLTMDKLPEGDVAKQALASNGFIIHAVNEQSIIELVNGLAPEHVVISSRRGSVLARRITNAGLITVGRNFPSVIADYYAGPNHVLPTGGRASSFSCLTILEYGKILNIVYGGKRASMRAYKDVKALVEAEGLLHHLEVLRRAGEGP